MWAVAILLIVLAACSAPSERAGNSSLSKSPAHAQDAAGPRRDLSADEARGGHVLKRHVGRTDGDLRERLEREHVSAASTYTDRATAERAVGAAIANNQGRIEKWFERGERRPNLVLDYSGTAPVGRVLNRGASEAIPCSHAVVVLKADGPRDFFVLTSYPECRI